MLSIDETAWHYSEKEGWRWGIIGQADAQASNAQGKRISLICALSTKRVEAMMLTEGSIKSTEFCYFITEAHKRFLENNKDEDWVKNGNQVMLYGNVFLIQLINFLLR